MKTLTKKLVLSLSVMLLALVAVATSTYAWFTVNGNIETESFEMKATSGEDLKIQLWGIKYNEDGSIEYSSITQGFVGQLSTTDFQKAIQYTVEGKTDGNFTISEKVKLDHLTTKDGKNLVKLEDKSKKVTEATGEKIAVEDEKDFTGSFITFAIEFQANMTGNVYLDSSTTECTGDVKTFVPAVSGVSFFNNAYDATTAESAEGSTQASESMATVTFSLPNALRIAFIKTDMKQTSAEQKADKYVKDSGDTPDAADPTLIIWEPGRGLGQGSIPSDMSKNFAVQYFNARKTGQTIEDAAYQTWYNVYEQFEAKTQDAARPARIFGTSDITSAENKVVLTKIADSKTTVLTVKIWIEGWDADCIDGIQDATADIKFGFKLVGSN